MDSCEEENQVSVIRDAVMEDSTDHQDQLYDAGTSLILNPATMSINSDVIGPENGIVTTTAVSATNVPSTGTITIGSQVYIIQSDPTQSAENALDQHAFVLQPDGGVSVGDIPTTQQEAISMQSTGEECVAEVEGGVMSGVNYITDQTGVYQNLSDAAGLGASEQGETITISLEEATQLMLQQGLEAVQMPDGSYQLLSQQFVQVTKEDGTVDTQAVPAEVVQALNGGMMYANIEGAQDAESVAPHSVITAVQAGLEDTSESSRTSQDGSANMEMVVSNAIPSGTAVTIRCDEKDNLQPVSSVENSSSSNVQQVTPVTHSANLAVSISASGSTTAVLEPPPEVVPLVKEEPKPDLNCPIEVTERTEVMIKGKKCVLMQNPDTKQLCAYPILPPQGKKRRGRPRKIRTEKLAEEESGNAIVDIAAADVNPVVNAQVQGVDKIASDAKEISVDLKDSSIAIGDQNSAAEGLLELSNTGPDSVRRSARKRKKTRVLEDYDVLEASSEDENTFNDDERDPDVTMYGVKKQKIKKDPLPLSNPFMIPVKRGRGRPRRYPPPGQTNTTSISAVILPSSNGQTLVMAPIQGIQNIPGLQSQVKAHLQQLMPKGPLPGTGDTTTTSTVLQPAPITTTNTTTAATTVLGPDGDALPVDTSAVLDANAILSTSLSGETIHLSGESSDMQEGLDLGDKERGEGDASTSIDNQQHTVIQIPDNLLPMFGIKKDPIPIKIGLKASESDLEKLKCPKCDFQGYYSQQFQDHISTHSEDIHKCKCCNYLTFDKDDLLQHFKATHPRCICNVCEFMAEHAYMIKRHMMRHNAEGCTCELCGKVYKDQYILKMHVKMVHMPAEVLFECTVCSKKFTRKAHLKRHLRIHEPEKPFKCPHCDYRGCERSDISKHLLIHEEPRHVCEVCQKAFRHIKNKELHVKRHNGQRDYKCGVCDFYGYTYTDIRKHIERKHSDVKTVMCERCSMHFKSEIQLREHQQHCEVMMIERALSVRTSAGGTSQATIQIPTSFAMDGQQITIDGQQIAVDSSHLNITVEQVPGDEVSLEHQLVETTIADIVTSADHELEGSDQVDLADGTVHIISTDDIDESMVPSPNELLDD